MPFILTFILLGVFSAGVIILQIFLSRRAYKWLGLILPAIPLFLSFLAVLGFAMYMPAALTEQSFKTILNVVEIPKAAAFLSALYIFVLYNIPTGILLGIYYFCRGKMKRANEIGEVQH